MAGTGASVRILLLVIVLVSLVSAASAGAAAGTGGGEWWGPARWTGRYLVAAYGNMLVVDGGGGITLPDTVKDIIVVDPTHVIVLMGSAIIYVEVSNTPVPLWSFSPGCSVVAAYPWRGDVVAVGYSGSSGILYVYVIDGGSGVWREAAAVSGVTEVFAAKLYGDRVVVAAHTTEIPLAVSNVTGEGLVVRAMSAAIITVDLPGGDYKVYPLVAPGDSGLWFLRVLSAAPAARGLLLALRVESQVPDINFTGTAVFVHPPAVYPKYSFLALVSPGPSVLGVASTCQEARIVDVTGDVFAVACSAETTSLKLYVYNESVGGLYGSYGYDLGQVNPTSIDVMGDYVAVAWGEGAYIVNASTGIPFAYFAEPVGYVYFFADKVFLGEPDGYRVLRVGPLGSLSVTVYAVNETVPGALVSAGGQVEHTDEAGRAVFVLPPGPVYVEVLFGDGTVWRGAAYVVAGAETNLFVHHENATAQPIWDRSFTLRVAAAPAEEPDKRLAGIHVEAVNLLTGDKYNATAGEKETDVTLFVRGGAYRVTVSAPDRKPASYTVIVADDTAVIARLELVKYKVVIRAIDALTGAPLSAIIKIGANTTVSSKPLYLPSGEYKVTISAPGYRTVTRTLIVEEDTNITVRMFRETYNIEITVYGLSILPPGNIPIERAGVCAEDTCDVTDKDGKVTLTLTAGQYILKVNHPDYMSYQTVLSVPDRTSLTIILNPSPILIARQVGPIVAVVSIAAGIYIYLRRRQMRWLREQEELFGEVLGAEEQPQSET